MSQTTPADVSATAEARLNKNYLTNKHLQLMKSIHNVNLGKVRNAEHFQFHSRMLAVLTQEKATELGIAAQRKAYADLFEKEDLAFKQSAGLGITRDIEEKDKLRDNLFSYVKLIIEANGYLPTPEKKLAAEKLADVIRPYRDANSKAYDEDTAYITNVVGDLLQEANATHIAALNLKEGIELLKEANDDFNDTYTQRSDTRFIRESGGKLKAIRQQVDDAFTVVVNAINALYQVNELVTHDAAKAASLAQLIDTINARINDFQRVLAQRGAGKRSDLPTDDVAPGTGDTGDDAPGTDPGTGGTDPGTGDDSGDIKTDFD